MSGSEKEIFDLIAANPNVTVEEFATQIEKHGTTVARGKIEFALPRFKEFVKFEKEMTSED